MFIFKCVYNKFQKHIFFEYPKSDDLTISPNIRHVTYLYNTELSQPVKIAYHFNDECLNPQTIEKTKVSLAVRTFGESTRNSYYALCEKETPRMGGDIELFKTYH